jgi:putative membrane protein
MDSLSVTALDRILGDLANAQGGLERIKNTPLPRQFSQLPQIFTRIYCILLPIGLVGDLGISTPIGSTVIGFLFLALDRIGSDLEDPFGNDVHDIPMEAITRTVEIDLLQAIGAEHVPEPVGPRDGVLRYAPSFF